jgi:hypothetical protein
LALSLASLGHRHNVDGFILKQWARFPDVELWVSDFGRALDIWSSALHKSPDSPHTCEWIFATAAILKRCRVQRVFCTAL